MSPIAISNLADEAAHVSFISSSTLLANRSCRTQRLQTRTPPTNDRRNLSIENQRFSCCILFVPRGAALYFSKVLPALSEHLSVPYKVNFWLASCVAVPDLLIAYTSQPQRRIVYRTSTVTLGMLPVNLEAFSEPITSMTGVARSIPTSAVSSAEKIVG